ncbi:hypothetical protein DMENIID0001_120160 [Sergentomyia squamirostris]
MPYKKLSTTCATLYVVICGQSSIGCKSQRMIWIWLVAFQLHPEKKTNYTDLCSYCSLFLLSSTSCLCVPSMPRKALPTDGGWVLRQSHLFWYPPLGVSITSWSSSSIASLLLARPSGSDGWRKVSNSHH